MDKAPYWWKMAKEKQNGQKGKKKKKEQAYAAVTEDTSNSGSNSCAFLYDFLTCSINWTNTIASKMDITAAAFIPPYLLDSGTTSHCSPYCEDFSDLKTIPACKIRGINGSSVSAIAIGTLHIGVGRGNNSP